MTTSTTPDDATDADGQQADADGARRAHTLAVDPRRDRRRVRRARVRRPGRPGGGAHRTGWQRRVGRGGAGGGIALAPTPELLAAVDALPPADDDPDIDVAAEAAASEHFRLRGSSARTAGRC